MTTRNEFAQRLFNENLTHCERAIAFLWYYRQSQEFEERTPSELAEDMSEEGFPRAQTTRLRKSLLRSHYAVRGRRADSFRLNLRYLTELSERYSEYTEQQPPQIQGLVLPTAWVTGTRAYLENLVLQINGCYQFSFYDGCAVLARRLMESLIIEIYVSQNRTNEIKTRGTFLQLDGLLAYICNDPSIPLSRGSPKIMRDLKGLGDTASHDRFYITQQIDIDDFKPKLRKLIRELLSLSGINP